MRATGQQPAARRADSSASKPSNTSKAKPRRALVPTTEGPSALAKVTKASVGLAAGAAMVTGLGLAGTGTAAAATNAPSLHKGDRGSAVVRLQRELSAHGPNVSDTGYFGSVTKKRVNHQKAQHGWRTDGIAGRRVWKVLLHDGHRVSSPALHKAHHAKKAVKSRSLSSSQAKGLRALKFAKRQLGDRYVYGAAGPNTFDCSGLTLAAWRSVGVKLPHNTNAQWRATHHVAKSHLRKGDLVFFYSGRSHVAIYAGNGKVIHAPKPGSRVSYIKMKYMPFNGAARPA
jgi:cell wall-associated NlpC family hydrolase